MTPRGLTPEDRFWEKVDRGITPDDCWYWTGGMSGPYGKLFIRRDEHGNTVTEYAHRFSNQIHYGPIPKGVEIDHTCNNTWCVNPRHGERVSGTENKRREGMRQTHCIHGHEYTSENTYIDGRGHRRCRECQVERRAA